MISYQLLWEIISVLHPTELLFRWRTPQMHIQICSASGRRAARAGFYSRWQQPGALRLSWPCLLPYFTSIHPHAEMCSSCPVLAFSKQLRLQAEGNEMWGRKEQQTTAPRFARWACGTSCLQYSPTPAQSCVLAPGRHLLALPDESRPEEREPPPSWKAPTLGWLTLTQIRKSAPVAGWQPQGRWPFLTAQAQPRGTVPPPCTPAATPPMLCYVHSKWQ